MSRLLHPVFALLASVTRQDLARQVGYLREKNRILRARLPERQVATPQERRRLLPPGRVAEVAEVAHTTKQSVLRRKLGWPRTPDNIRELVLS